MNLKIWVVGPPTYFGSPGWPQLKVEGPSESSDESSSSASVDENERKRARHEGDRAQGS